MAGWAKAMAEPQERPEPYHWLAVALAAVFSYFAWRGYAGWVDTGSAAQYMRIVHLIGVIAMIGGTLCLLIRLRWAVLLFLIAGIASVAWGVLLYLTTDAGVSNDFSMLEIPYLPMFVGLGFWAYARFARGVGWLR